MYIYHANYLYIEIEIEWWSFIRLPKPPDMWIKKMQTSGYRKYCDAAPARAGDIFT